MNTNGPNTHAVLTHDTDKTLCSVRIFERAGRKAASVPMDVTCDVCALRVLRLQQADGLDLAVWPAGVGGVPAKGRT